MPHRLAMGVAVRRAIGAVGLFVVSVTVLSGLAYGAALVVQPIRGCYGDEGICWNASPAMPTLYLGPGDSGRTVRVTEGQVIEIDRGPHPPSGELTDDDYNNNVLEFVRPVPGSRAERILAYGHGSARIFTVVGPWCTDLRAACPAGPPPGFVSPGFRLTVIVG